MKHDRKIGLNRAHARKNSGMCLQIERVPRVQRGLGESECRLQIRPESRMAYLKTGRTFFLRSYGVDYHTVLLLPELPVV